jgi:hypothetical protein
VLLLRSLRVKVLLPFFFLQSLFSVRVVLRSSVSRLMASSFAGSFVLPCLHFSVFLFRFR